MSRKNIAVIPVLVALLVGLSFAGCGSSSPASSSSASSTASTSGTSAATPDDQAQTTTVSEEAAEPAIPNLKLTGPAGTSAGAKEVCAMISTAEMEQLLPMPATRYDQQIQLHPKPLPVHPYPGSTQFSCTYEDQFEYLWLSYGFTKSETSLEDLVSHELKTEGDREFIPIEIDGHSGYYTPGTTGLGFTTELLLQIEDGLYFGVSPYKTSGAPGTSSTEQQSPPWVQGVAEELAKAILS